MNPSRVGNGFVAFANAGIIASSQGTATAAPRPRRSVRREIGWMLISRRPSLILYVFAASQAERIAFYNFDHQRGKLVFILGQRAQRAIDSAVVIRFDAAAQRIDHHLLDHASGEKVL